MGSINLPVGSHTNGRFKFLAVVSAVMTIATSGAQADIKQVEKIPLNIKASGIDTYMARLPKGTSIQRTTDGNGHPVFITSDKTDTRLIRFNAAGDLIGFEIKYKKLMAKAYRDNVVDFIWQHGPPNYVVLPNVEGYPAGSAKACLSPGSKPGRAKLDVACLERYLPKDPLAFVSWVNNSINRLKRHPNLLWACKSSSKSPTIVSPDARPDHCYVKISTDGDCVGSGSHMSCQQSVTYSNVDLVRQSLRLADTDNKTNEEPLSARAEKPERQAQPDNRRPIPESENRDSEEPKTAALPAEKLEKAYDIHGLLLNSNLSDIEKFLRSRTGASFTRTETRNVVALAGDSEDGSWSVEYDKRNSVLLRASFSSPKLPLQAKRETYAALLRKYGMPYHLQTNYGQLLAQRGHAFGNATEAQYAATKKQNSCFTTCCGGPDKIKTCKPDPSTNQCFNDCYYPKPPDEVEALINWLFVDNPSVPQQRLLGDMVRPTFWSCSRSAPVDIIRSQQQHSCYLTAKFKTSKAHFSYGLEYADVGEITRYERETSRAQQEKENLQREKASQARASAYRKAKADKEARYAAIDEAISKHYPFLSPARLEFLREKWRSYEDFKAWMATELELPYWQKTPEAERKAKLLAALTSNVRLQGAPSYSDPYRRDAARDYKLFERRLRSFDTANTRAMIDKKMNDAEFQSIVDPKARRNAVIAELEKQRPAQLQGYFSELEKVRQCYNNGNAGAGRVGGTKTYQQSAECSGYTTARDVNVGYAKKPNWEP